MAKMNEYNAAFLKDMFELYEGCWLLQTTVPAMDMVKNLEVDDADIFVTSFPKSGTTWMQQIVTLVLNGANIEKAAERHMDDRFPYLEETVEGMQRIQSMEHPRMYKTHLPYYLLPEQAKAGKGKIIYVARNIKDTLVSYWHFHKIFKEPNQYKGDVADFMDLFVNGIGYGPWWEHVAAYWNHRKDDNVFFITYEEMHQDLPGCIRRVASFLNTPVDDAQVDFIVKQTSFSTMSKDDSVNQKWNDKKYLDFTVGKFMRKGKIGDWRNHLTDDISARLEELVEKHLSPLGLKFSYE